MKKKLNILIACEFSGIVRTAFEERGWNAISCDLLPTELPGKHFQCDVFGCLHKHNRWDLLIAHPPCTYLANSGVRWLYGPDGERIEERWCEVKKGALFFKKLWEQSIPHIAIENPVMHKYAREIIFGKRQTRKPDNVLQPWMFGHTQVKATCLWTRNLPKLVPTNNVREETMALPYGERAKVHYASPGPDRWKERSRTLPGLAKAMADQWGTYIENLTK